MVGNSRGPLSNTDIGRRQHPRFFARLSLWKEKSKTDENLKDSKDQASAGQSLQIQLWLQYSVLTFLDLHTLCIVFASVHTNFHIFLGMARTMQKWHTATQIAAVGKKGGGHLPYAGVL